MPHDLGLFGDASEPADVERRLDGLRVATGADRIVLARQVHGRDVAVHGDGASGLELVHGCDAHATCRAGVLLTVTTADCVPVSIVDEATPAVAMVHAGWRGVAAGVLEAAVGRLRADFGTAVRDVHVHLGPSICAACYEVGPEVFVALGRPEPPAPSTVDLRGVLAERAVGLGVAPARITVSAHCTRCTGSGLFSHRAGDRERQVGYLGIRSSGPRRAR